MSGTYLKHVDPDKNMLRFYNTTVMLGIFGEWALVREWGRIGSAGTVRKNWFATEAEALAAEQKLCAAKRKKGYVVVKNQ
jgi:predicted DNA-binding WGR domain protein